MTRALLMVMAALMLTSCGVKRPLMKPEDIAAHEEKRAKENEQREVDRKAEEQRRQMLQAIQPR